MNWIDQLDKSTTDYKEAFFHLEPEQLGFKPNDKDWSIGQVIDHIITTNSCYYPVFDQVLKGQGSRHFMARIPGLPKMFGNMIYKASHESRSKKGKTVKVFQPSQNEVKASIWDDFERMQARIKAYIEQFEEQHLSTVISSPAAPFVVYTLEMALNIICTHEQRHLKQGLEVRKLLLKQ